MKKNFRYESSYESEYKQRIQEVIEYILDECKWGQTIPFEKLANMLHYNIEDEQENKKFKSTMARIKNYLIDYGYVLKSVTGVGYYILKPKQISGYCYHTYIRKTENLLNKSARILQHTRKSELSEIRMEEYNNVVDLNFDVTNAIDSTIESSKYYAKKNIYDNLED
jgi:hypothetical protein